MEGVEFQIILHAGNDRSSAMESIAYTKSGNMFRAREALENSSKELSQAHQIQTSLIHKEAAEKKTEVTLLMIHAQDHLMNAITIKDLAVEFVDLYQTISINGRLEV